MRQVLEIAHQHLGDEKHEFDGEVMDKRREDAMEAFHRIVSEQKGFAGTAKNKGEPLQNVKNFNDLQEHTVLFPQRAGG